MRSSCGMPPSWRQPDQRAKAGHLFTQRPDRGTGACPSCRQRHRRRRSSAADDPSYLPSRSRRPADQSRATWSMSPASNSVPAIIGTRMRYQLSSSAGGSIHEKRLAEDNLGDGFAALYGARLLRGFIVRQFGYPGEDGAALALAYVYSLERDQLGPGRVTLVDGTRQAQDARQVDQRAVAVVVGDQAALTSRNRLPSAAVPSLPARRHARRLAGSAISTGLFDGLPRQRWSELEMTGQHERWGRTRPAILAYPDR